ncbi:MAG: hypothetical protein J5833_05985 [Victivallales bacterium]|nr:hypothetical protein [Victivallales bacterium]
MAILEKSRSFAAAAFVRPIYYGVSVRRRPFSDGRNLPAEGRAQMVRKLHRRILLGGHGLLWEHDRRRFGTVRAN